MSIIINDLSYHCPNQNSLFSHLNFAIASQSKVAIIGSNGSGKSTLLKLFSGLLQPSGGNIVCTSKPYYIPQYTGLLGKNVAEFLSVDKKIAALQAIMQGSISQADYDILDDDWNIESRCEEALAHWQLSHIKLDTSVDDLSGGEKTKILLAGLLIHKPEIILLDEPSNHLDQTGRELLYQYIAKSNETVVIVSHDITLLNQLDTTYELSEHGIRLYGGNYSFYREQKEIEINALSSDIHAEEKALRLARKQAQEVKQKQEKRANQGDKNKGELVRAMRKKLLNAGENTAAKLNDKHAEIIDDSKAKLIELRKQQSALKNLKINFNNSNLHSGKLLMEASGINYQYQRKETLWYMPIDFKLFSNDRIHITGANGSGKTTFIKILTGELTPTCGEVTKTPFSWIYLDQNYTKVDVDCTVEELAKLYNINNLEDSEVKLRLNRFLFPADTWDKNCKTLSGGEKMRLYLCCLMISNHTPDLIILDEPTNNLDLSGLQILTQTIKHYKGSVLVISHDKHFVHEIGITGTITM